MPIELDDSPVWDEYRRQTEADLAAPVDLTPLWHGAGRPRGRSPRQWDARRRRCGCESAIVADDGDRGGKGVVLADANDALTYAQVLDVRLMRAVGEVFWRSLHADPARHLMGCPGPVMAFFAVPAAMKAEGVDAEEAGRRLVAEVVERTADQGVYAQETTVAKVQRAVRSVRVHPGDDA
jgi:hypothetical protein